MTLMTPLTAFTPHSVLPGPLITSMRSTSSSITSCTSQKTPENSGEYTDRPSISTSSLLDALPANPRALMAYALALACATCRFGASRSASGRLLAPERRMSSAVMTNTEAAASERRSGRFDTEVISTLASSSSERSTRFRASNSAAPAPGMKAVPPASTSSRPSLPALQVSCFFICQAPESIMPS
jgi:hypothetical protein